jgi:hypothetical protein
MPYAGGVYTVPPGTEATTLTPIDSSDYNAFVEDIEQAQNTVRPIVAGGTGEVTAGAALTALGGQPAAAALTALSTAFTPASASAAASLALLEDADNGSNAVSLKAPASIAANVDLTLPGTADTLVGRATTDTLTNKRVTPRVTTITSSGTPTVNTDNTDFVNITAQAAAITSMTTNLSGTPAIGEVLVFQIKDNGTARAITWGASFTAKGAALPTTTVISKLLTVAFLWNGSNWGCVGSAQEA